MRYLIRRIRGVRLFGPVYARHYVRNAIGYFFKVIDVTLHTNLAARWQKARISASADAFALKKGPFTTRAIWREFRKAAS